MSVNAVAEKKSYNATEVLDNYSAETAQMEAFLDSARWSKELDEVVVTGQGGTIQKRRLSSNVSTIKAQDIGKLNTDRLDNTLQTAVPNMQINLSNGQPGAASMVRSRGILKRAD